MTSFADSQPAALRQPVRVFFPCTGLGRQRRGFEAFTLECADALRDDARIEMTVFAGRPIAELPARAIWNLPRDSQASEWLGRMVGRGSYFVEQFTFFLAFLPHLVAGKPDVIYFADLNLGNLCWHWRRLTKQRYRLLFYNGGMTTMPFTRADFVQQLTPEGLAEASARGEDPSRQGLLPHGVRIPADVPSRIIGDERLALGLPPNRPVVLSVGMLDTTVKRMDYLIREVAALPEPRPFLCLLGAEDRQTRVVRELAMHLLGNENVLIRSVSNAEISTWYRAADLFVLSSLREGFGLAYVEALAHGLPIIAHDFPVTRYLLGDFARLTDLTIAGAATREIADALSVPLSEDERSTRHASARSRFGWATLRQQYVDMLCRVAAMPEAVTA